MQQDAEAWARPVVEFGLDGLGPMRLLVEAVEAFGVEGPDGVTGALRGTGEPDGDGGGPDPFGAGREALTAAEGEGIWGAKTRLEGGSLVLGQAADKAWRIHPIDDGRTPPDPTRSSLILN